MVNIGKALLILMATTPVAAHEAPTGWFYPMECCGNKDCRVLSDKMIGEQPAGYLIRATNETVPYNDRRIKQSPDGVYHWCSVNGDEKTATICLFVPPKGM